MLPRPTSKRRSKAMKAIYSAFAVFAIGAFPGYYLPTSGGPQLSMVMLALFSIPFGSRSRTVVRGLLTGLAIGLLGGMTMVCSLAQYSVVSPYAASMWILGIGFLQAALWGSPFGLSMNLWGALTAASVLVPNVSFAPRALAALAVGTVVLCTVVSGLFAYLARKRSEGLDRQWGE